MKTFLSKNKKKAATMFIIFSDIMIGEQTFISPQLKNMPLLVIDMLYTS